MNLRETTSLAALLIGRGCGLCGHASTIRPGQGLRTYWKPNRDATDRRQSELRPAAGEMFDLVTARQVRSH